jgi:hypothetical protein
MANAQGACFRFGQSSSHFVRGTHLTTQVKLSLFDIVLYIDDSGSMAFEEGGERIDDLKL